MAKKIEIPKDNNILKTPIEEAMPDNYLPYAVEVAKDRALPDVRDGLKPVHRRILYGAYMLKAFPDKPYFKSARIVGDILGKYHPHGDSSVYESMVILAQNFSTRMPLIDGHGNWGSQDGDSAAAMRYTEARLTKLSMEMLRDIDKGVVDMMDNYSSSELEPKVLPARYPNLLVNGTFGIAVGLATNIPPHNLREVIDATLAYIDNNEITTDELMNYVKGPDLPTGGVLIGKNALRAAYETGEGKVTLRAKANIEQLENGRLGIVITEFPYRKSKAKLLQSISEMTDDKRHAKALEAITDIRDESDRTGTRAVIELRKSIDKDGAEKILKYLYKKTELQSNLSFNMVALADGKPETLGLKSILMHYVNHQKEVVRRRTERELDIAKRRFHIVEGFIKAIDIIDEIIAVIRGSKSKKDSENNLCAKFGFTEIQAEAIVELMLYRLTGLEIKTFEKEYKELEKDIKRLSRILENEKELLKVIKNELLEICEKYSDERRTLLVEDDDEAKIDLEELIVVEDIVITLSNEGFIKRVALKSYNRSSSNVEDIEYREGDYNKFLINSNTKDTVIIFTDKGNMYQTKGANIPEQRWKEKGTKSDELIKGLNLSEETIVDIFSINDFSAQLDFMFITSRGIIKKTCLDKFITSYSKLVALKLKDNERLIDIKMLPREREEKFIRLKTQEGLDFTVDEPVIEPIDRNIMGVQLAPIAEKDPVISVEYCEEYEHRSFYVKLIDKGIIKTVSSVRKNDRSLFKTFTNSSETILIFTEEGQMYSIPSYMLQNIEDQGIEIEKILDDFKPSNKIINLYSVSNFNQDVAVYFFSKFGLVKKTYLSELNCQSNTVLVYKLKNAGDKLISVAMGRINDKGTLIVVTKRGMGIRISSSSVNSMGRNASGVTAISLREDDTVIFGGYNPSYKNDSAFDELAIGKETSEILQLITNKGNNLDVNIDDIKIQNRAGRGSNLMLVVMDEFLNEVIMKEK